MSQTCVPNGRLLSLRTFSDRSIVAETSIAQEAETQSFACLALSCMVLWGSLKSSTEIIGEDPGIGAQI
jgi:hypothetical protein